MSRLSIEEQQQLANLLMKKIKLDWLENDSTSFKAIFSLMEDLPLDITIAAVKAHTPIDFMIKTSLDQNQEWYNDFHLKNLKK